MDSQGRLHMPNFVGMTYEETGIEDEATPDEKTGNRKDRRREEAIARKSRELESLLATAKNA